MSFKNKSSDFMISVSSLANDLIVIISMITIIYSLITFSIYIRDKLFKSGGNYHKYMFISLFFLMITMTIVFLSYATIFSHKNIFVFLYDTLIRNKNIDVLVILTKAILVYHYIYLSSVNSIIINYLLSNKKDDITLPVLIIIALIFLFLIIYFVYNSQFLIIFIFDIFLYLIGSIFWKEKK